MILKTYTTMKIGGEAEQIVLLRDLSQIKVKLPEPIRILGNGSNILIDDRGLKGTVIVVRDFPPSIPEVLEEADDSLTLKVSAGMLLQALSKWTTSRGWTGCEYMVGVPGTVGGAVAQNAGATRQEMKDILVSVESWNIRTQLMSTRKVSDCGMSYRRSNFKDQPDELIVSVVIECKKGDAQKIQNLIQENLQYRRTKTPFSKPSLGSVFTRLPLENGGWLYPGKLIEDAGLKGASAGGAQISEIHANYIINEQAATFDDVMTLIHLAEKKVLEHSGCKLRREIEIWSDR